MKPEKLNSGATAFGLPKEPSLRMRAIRWRAHDGLRSADPTIQQYRCFWGRSGIYHSLGFLGISRGDRILVPAYICAAAVDPILAYGAEVDFYRITKECKPDFADLETKIQSRTKGVLLVHYFGFQADVQTYSAICRQYNLVLIEDCAHVLKGCAERDAPGTVGDASIFSWRKFLPVYDGGTLFINRPRREYTVAWRRQSLVFNLKAAVNLLDHTAGSGRHPVLQSISKAAGYARSRILRRTRIGTGYLPPTSIDMNTLEFDPNFVNCAMSGISRWILEHSDIDWVRSRRVSNYNYLLQALADVVGAVPIYPVLPSGVCPWVFPVRLDQIPEACLKLRNIGVPAVSWSGVRHQSISRREFPEADFLYDNLLFLPIHQDLNEQQLAWMACNVRTVIQNADRRN
jgi:perosamine synthetase